VEIEWDNNKAYSNLKKHGINFGDAVSILEDDRALTITEDNSEEMR